MATTCNACGEAIPENATTCPQCGNPVNPNTKPDQPSIGLNILSFLIPLAGWIMYFVFRKETPIKAKGCATWAWIGFGIGFILNLIMRF